MHRSLSISLALVVLTGVARAQAGELAWRVGAPEWRGPEAWRAGGSEGEPASGVEPGASLVEGALVDPGEGETLAGRLAVRPPPVSREGLDGAAEEHAAYGRVPGGIVLGLVARADGGLAAELAGARLVRGESCPIELRLASGRVLRAPAIEPRALDALLAFVASGRDALVDLESGASRRARLAPALAGGALEELLVRMDAVPHRRMPETRAWKSLIVDRDARFEARGNELVLAADLEVRLYLDEGGSGRARRASTVEVPAPGFVGPRTTGSELLAAELAPLAELAGWIGFLRRAAELDPAGFAALRSPEALPSGALAHGLAH